MKRNTYQVSVQASLLFCIVLVLAAMIFATVILSSATPNSMIPTAVGRPSISQNENREKLWESLTLMIRENANEMDHLNDAMSKKSGTMNAVVHMKLHRRIIEVHLEQLKEIIPRFETLYAGMSDEEKAMADKLFQTGKWEVRESYTDASAR